MLNSDSDPNALAKVGELATLRVVSIEPVGAFLDWGLPKNLFLPFGEQTWPVEAGDEVVVFLYIDNTGRIASSMRLEKFLDKDASSYKPEQKVDLLVIDETDLGYKAVINSKHLGMLFKNEVFQDLRYADRIAGYIKQVRDDGKVDLILQPFGSKGAGDLGQKILDLLKQKEGFLPLTDKSPPEVIYELFGVSKKKYKMALGGIYKKKLITIEENGIRLISSSNLK
ncbi:MAG: S1-like domain-containing RNA-binding protein [Bdellovibrionota bacterium]